LRDLRGASDLLVAVAAVLKVGHRRVSVLVGGAADDPRLGIGIFLLHTSRAIFAEVLMVA